MRCEPKKIYGPGDCEWERCVRCGLTIQDCNGNARTAWGKLPDCGKLIQNRKARDHPDRARMVSKYVVAVTKWMAAGRPVRPPEEVERIFDDVCRPCQEFNDGRGSCQVCGCKVNRSGGALRNKLRMMTEICPLGKWGNL